MKRKLYILIVPVIIISAVFLSVRQSKMPLAEVIIGGKWIHAEVAQNPSSRERGLGGRRSLKEGTGMLFVFSERGYQTFWMKGMLIPIDIIWIDGKAIVDIAPNVPPPRGGGGLPLYRPRTEADFVLEVPAGFAEKSRWKIGDGVVIKY